MWSRLKGVVAGVAQQLGVEIPEFPVDLEPLTETVTTATERVGDAAVAVADAAPADAAPAVPAGGDLERAG